MEEIDKSDEKVAEKLPGNKTGAHLFNKDNALARGNLAERPRKNGKFIQGKNPPKVQFPKRLSHKHRAMARYMVVHGATGREIAKRYKFSYEYVRRIKWWPVFKEYAATIQEKAEYEVREIRKDLEQMAHSAVSNIEDDLHVDPSKSVALRQHRHKVSTDVLDRVGAHSKVIDPAPVSRVNIQKMQVVINDMSPEALDKFIEERLAKTALLTEGTGG